MPSASGNARKSKHVQRGTRASKFEDRTSKMRGQELNVKDEEYELGWLLSAIHRAISVALATTRTKDQDSFAHASMATASVRNTQFADYLHDMQFKPKT